MQGGSLLVSESETPNHFIDHISNTCFQNRFERGFNMTVKAHSVALPLSFPRLFTAKRFNEDGLLKPPLETEEAYEKEKDEFVLNAPVVTRLAQDASYLPQVELAHHKLRNIRPALKVQLLRD